MIEISVSNVQKSFGFKRVLDGFDLEASTGERIALIGPMVVIRQLYKDINLK